MRSALGYEVRVPALSLPFDLRHHIGETERVEIYSPETANFERLAAVEVVEHHSVLSVYSIDC